MRGLMKLEVHHPMLGTLNEGRGWKDTLSIHE
jgi:hypothetical protein